MDTPRTPWARAQQILLPLWLVAAIVIFAAVVHPHYPIERWLFWRYAGYWLACAVWATSCLGLGHAVLRRLVGLRLPLLQHLAVAFPLGILGFELLMFAAGMLGLFRTATFFGLPLAVLALTGPRLVADGRRWFAHLRAHQRRLPKLAPWKLLLPLFGAAALALLYFTILSPDNVQFDARWKHLAIAEDWVAAGEARRFDEGWVFSTRSHFHSYIYAWGWLHPSGVLFDRIELCQHLEFTIFLLVTLIAIPAMVRALIPGADPRLVWAARFLFPGIFLYDSNLSGGIDHIQAMYCAPFLILLLRARRDLDWRWLALLGAVIAGCLMGKETGTLIMAPLAVALVAARAGQFAVRAARGRLAPHLRHAWWLGPLAATLAVVVVSAPHWVTNMVRHGDPFYPILHEHFDSRPWTPDATGLYNSYIDVQMWRPERSLAGVRETLGALVDFSFVPNDWKRFHGVMPVFGSLMTLLIPCLLFLRGTRRIWLVVAWVHAGVFAWYWTHHQDRYLQAILPWMTVVTAATMVLLWRQSRAPTRAALCGLVALQIVWGGDVAFIPTNPMVGTPIKKSAELLGLGYKRKYDERLKTQGVWSELGDALPDGARVLLHDNHQHLGVRVTSVSDWPTWQFGISYGLLDSPRDVWQLLRDMGVTHVFWPTGKSVAFDSVASDLMFYNFAMRHTQHHRRFSGNTLGVMPDEPPPGPDEFDDRTLVLGCGKGGYRSGLYRVGQLQTKELDPSSVVDPDPVRAVPDQPARPELDKLLAEPAFVALDPACHEKDKAAVRRSFELAITRTRLSKAVNVPYELYVRRAAQPAAEPDDKLKTTPGKAAPEDVPPPELDPENE